MYQEQMMIDPILQRELKPGEQLLWWGRPDPARKAKTANLQSTSYIVYSILCIFIIGLIASTVQLAIFEHTYLSGPKNSTLILLVATIGLLGLMIYRMYAAYTRQQKRVTDLRNTCYGISTRRIITITSGQQGLSVRSYTQEDIGQINRIETGGGWGDVAFGKVRQIQSGMRTLAITERLQGIPNAHIVENILVNTFKSGAQGTPQATQYPPQAPQYPPQATQYPPQAPQYPQQMPQYPPQMPQYPPLLLQYDQPPTPQPPYTPRPQE